MKSSTTFALILAAGFGTCGLLAQTTPGTSVSRQVGPPALHLSVELQDANGRPVRGIPATSLQLLENGVVQPSASFHEVQGFDSARVILLIDAVNVPYIGVASERERLTEYLRKTLGPLPLKTSIGFISDTGVEVLPTFTTDPQLLNKALKNAKIPIREITRAAGFYGASERLEDSLKGLGLLINDASHIHERTLLVWLSAGWPLLSGPGVDLQNRQREQIFRTIVQLNTEMQLAHVTLYDVDAWGPQESVLRSTYYLNFLKGAKDLRDIEIGDLGLQVLAVQSGGLAAPPSNDIGKPLDRVYADGSDFYTLSFNPSTGEQSNEYHALKVRSPQGTARTQTGYYADPHWGEGAVPDSK